MNSLESKVTSLPLSRKLAAAFKEKGIKPPESEFKWIKVKIEGANFVLRVHDHGWDGAEEYPAYLSDELLEGMPVVINNQYEFRIALLRSGIWELSYADEGCLEIIENKSLPNACAEMTLWLIDNGYYDTPT